MVDDMPKRSMLKEKIKDFPKTPGVYIMRSKEGGVLYVGKALSLKKRVGSYFARTLHSPKADILLAAVADIEHIECATEEQALILEASLIKEKKPKYNIALRDGESYLYLEITREKFPRIYPVRKILCGKPQVRYSFLAGAEFNTLSEISNRIYIRRPKKKIKGFLFGPYPKAKPLKAALNLIRRIFPYRSCTAMPKRACLFLHLDLCPAPCAKKISSSEYKENIKSICKVLRGQRKELVRGLQKDMERLAGNEKFEQAALIRDKLLAIHNLYWGRAQTHQLISLKEILDLPSLPLIIEAIDISSLRQEEAVGSLVVFKDGAPDKKNYRRFLIKEVQNLDDYAMMAEVVRRRYSRCRREKKKLPDLIIIDGGRAHARRARRELEKLGVVSPLIGIAKRNEEIWFPHKNEPLIIPKDNSCLHLIQRVRDEAHRFAHNYHLLRRKKKMME